MKWQEVAENCIMGSFITCTLRQNEEVKEDEMGKAGNTHGEKNNVYGGKYRRKDTTRKI
jgi:hypothetical protein